MLDTPERNRFLAGPPPASRILRPGVQLLPPGHERYRVPGGGSVVVALEPGDRITLASRAGGQVCELVAADANGGAAPVSPKPVSLARRPCRP